LTEVGLPDDIRAHKRLGGALRYDPAFLKHIVLNQHLMHDVDEQYTKTPFYGWPRMTAQLHRRGYEMDQ
jgi:hypothetical protein